MGRAKELDQLAALDLAVQCFWAHGYEATSVRTPAQQMGITGASPCNSSGDKRALYRQAMDRYVERSFRERVGRLEGHLSPREALGQHVRALLLGIRVLARSRLDRHVLEGIVSSATAMLDG